jgi:dTDP-4-dehydrorhamnose reductase
MRVLIVGADGQLGTDLCKSLAGTDLIPLNQNDIEITDIDSVLSACRKHHPQVIINTASYIKVDDCEDNLDLAYRVNVLGARNLAVAAHSCGAALAHLSTDYVFGGDSGRSVPYTEFDTTAPLNAYGKSKLAGEQLIQSLCCKYFIIRTSVLYGTAACIGKGTNFVDSVIKLAGWQKELRMVSDQVFSTTFSRDLAGKISELIRTQYYGIFHITNRGACSWYDFAEEILRISGSKSRVIPIAGAEYITRAVRPGYTVLSNYHLKLAGLGDMRDWHEALLDYMTEKFPS